MPAQLKISVDQHSDKGRKDANQDFHGLCIPREPQLSGKGIAIALADGISSSSVGHVASESAGKGFLEDCFCTSDAWSVKRSTQRVLAATISWLHAQTQQSQWRYDKDRGYVRTFSAMVLKSATAHLFHVGDARICCLHGQALEQLTTDYRVIVAQDDGFRIVRELHASFRNHLYLAQDEECGQHAGGATRRATAGHAGHRAVQRTGIPPGR